MSTSRTERFISEFTTATSLQAIAEKMNRKMTLEQAHEAWMEHSDDYCAQWLVPDAHDPVSEMKLAINKYFVRRNKS